VLSFLQSPATCKKYICAGNIDYNNDHSDKLLCKDAELPISEFLAFLNDTGKLLQSRDRLLNFNVKLNTCPIKSINLQNNISEP
jgi:hypothetical protein